MSSYVRYYNSRQNFHRELATKWARWAKTANLSETQVVGVSKFFRPIAKRFGLIKEFRELGIL